MRNILYISVMLVLLLPCYGQHVIKHKVFTPPTPLGQWNLAGCTTSGSGCTPSSSTTAYDQTGNGYAGTWQGTDPNPGGPTYWYGAGLINQYAGLFDGSTNGVFLGTSAGLLAPFASQSISLSCWFKANNVVGSTILIGQAKSIGSGNSSMYIYGAVGNPIRAAAQNASSTTVTAISAANITYGTWHLVVATYDGAHVILYYDGNQVDSEVQTGNLKSIASTYQPSIGAGDNAGTVANPFNGVIGPCGVYSTVLTATQAQQMYQAAW